MTLPRSDAIVFFGATGDLAYKKIFPALQAMIQRGTLDMPVVGVAKAGWNLEQFKERARESVKKFGKWDDAAFEKLCRMLRYVDGDYRDQETFTRLRQLLGSVERPLHYLAVPPSMFAIVAEGLEKADCTKNARVVVEKPFGRSLASARELNETLHRFFPEESIFRIDHYLGKEPVQNLLYFRFANPFIDAGWSARHLESVQITMAEAFGVEGRGRLYEEMGAIRDVVQNHMLEVVANLAMDRPVRKGHDARRDERARLLHSIRTLEPSDVVRGQYIGYRKEEGVDPQSTVETFAAICFHIDNDRWNGVPFYVRVGKCLPVSITEVRVRYRRPIRPVLDETGPTSANYFRLRLSPEVVIALGTRVKKPGEQMVGERIELLAHHQHLNEMQPYERLLCDAADGDTTLFARQDAVEDSWRIVDPILGDATPLYFYAPGTWGPPEVERLMRPEEGWYNPESATATT